MKALQWTFAFVLSSSCFANAAQVTPFTNQAPSFTLSSDAVSSSENVGPVTITNFLTALSPGPASEAKQSLSFIVRAITNSSGNVSFAKAPVLVRKGENANLCFTTSLNSYGTNRINIILKDSGGIANGGINTYTDSFNLNIAWVDQPPKFGHIPNVSVLENVGTNTAVIRVFDVDSSWDTLSLGVLSTNLALADVRVTATNASTQTNLLLGTNVVDFTLAFTPATNANGRTTVLLVAGDGEKSTTNKLNLTVIPVNQAPTCTITTNLVLACENAGLFIFTNLLTGLNAGPADESRQSLSFTVMTSSNSGGSLTFSKSPRVLQKGTNANLTFGTASNCYGTNIMMVIIKDGGDTKNGGVNAMTNHFTLGVFWTNQPPRLSSSGKLSILENVMTNVATVRVFDVDSAWTNLTLTATSANPSLVSVSIIATNISTQTNLLAGTNAADFTLAFAPATNTFGTTIINLEASDGERVTAAKLILTINPVNQQPHYLLATNLVLASENAGPITVTNLLTALCAGPVNESKQTLTLAVLTETNLSHNATFARVPDFIVKGTNATLSFTTTTNAFGTNSITVILKDNGSTLNGGINCFTNSFELGVAWVNQPPRMGNYTNRTLLENSGTNLSLIRVFDVDTPWTNLFLTAWPSNSDLVDVSIIATNSSTQTNPLIGTNAVDFTLAIVPKTNAVGTTRVLLAASDGQRSITNNFTLSILAINQPPRFNLSLSSVIVDQFGIAYSIPETVTDISAGATNEAKQTVTFIVTNSSPSSFLVQPAIATNGTLTFTPDAQAGNVTVTVMARDNGGTANGGSDTSAGQAFTIAIPSNPFLGLQGTYGGLFFDANAYANDSSGYFQMALNSSGTFSGFLLRAGNSNCFSGQFGVTNPTVALDFTNSPCVLTLTLETGTNTSESVSGSVSNETDGWESTLLAFLNVYSTNSVSPLAGQYRLVVPGNADPSVSPSGDSLISLNIGDVGIVSVLGSLADGKSVTQDTCISRGGQLPLYLGLGSTGSMSGWLTFTNVVESWLSSESSVLWIEQSGGMFYPEGFTNTAAAIASEYDGGALEVLAIASGFVVLSGGNLDEAITNSVSISNNLIAVDPSSTNGLALTIDIASGRIEGQFVTADNSTNMIHGLILQSFNRGRGYFLGPNQSGCFLLFGE